VTLTSATTVTATFDLQTFTLTVSKAGTSDGTVTSTPAGITCGPSCAGTYASGTAVTLTAAPAANAIFTGWSGGSCAGTGSCSVTLTNAITVTATFELQAFTLTVTETGSGSGTVTSTPDGITCGPSCVGSYASGTVAMLTATSAADSTFVGWSGGGCTGNGPCTVTLTGATTVTAHFDALAPLTLTSLTADLSAPQSPGTAITFTATATGGTAPYEYKWWVNHGAASVGQDWSTS